MITQKLSVILMLSMLMCLLIETLPLESKQLTDCYEQGGDTSKCKEQFGHQKNEETSKISHKESKAVEKKLLRLTRNVCCNTPYCDCPPPKYDPYVPKCNETIKVDCRPPDEE